MDEGTILAYLALKRLLPHAIHRDLLDTLRHNAVESTSLTHYLREACHLHSEQRSPSIENDRGINKSDQAILFALDETRFASARQLFRLTDIPSTTIQRHFT
jgi:hypothetical protein